MAFREVRVNEVQEVLRCWLAGDGLRTVAVRAGVDRKTARRYVEAAQAAGLVREGGAEQLCDELIGQVIVAVRPARLAGHGAAWEALLAHVSPPSERARRDALLDALLLLAQLGLATGDAIEIEERDADEVRSAGGALLTVPGTRCRNPAFDVTPAELVLALVTERGTASPVTAASVAAVA